MCSSTEFQTRVLIASCCEYFSLSTVIKNILETSQISDHDRQFFGKALRYLVYFTGHRFEPSFYGLYGKKDLLSFLTTYFNSLKSSLFTDNSCKTVETHHCVWVTCGLFAKLEDFETRAFSVPINNHAKIVHWHESLRKYTLGLDFTEVRVIPPFSTLGELRNQRVMETLNAIDRFYSCSILSYESLSSNPVLFVREEGTTYPKALTVSFERAIQDYVRRIPKASRKMDVEAPRHRLRGEAVVKKTSQTNQSKIVMFEVVCFCGLEMEAVKQSRLYDFPSSCDVCKALIVADDNPP